MKKMLITLAPSPLQGLTEVGLNTDFWGNTIRKGYPQDDVRASDSGAMRTPTIWHELAKGVYEMSGGTLDMAPESFRALSSSYLQGPLQAIFSWIDNDPFVKDPMYKNTRDTLGPMLTALGATSIYASATNMPRREMYEFQDKCDKIIREAGLHEALILNGTINPRTGKPYTAPDKRYDALIMSGYSQDFAEDYVRNYQMGRKLQSMASNYRKKVETAIAQGASAEMIQQMNDARWIEEQIYIKDQLKHMNYNLGNYNVDAIKPPSPDMVKFTIATLGGGKE